MEDLQTVASKSVSQHTDSFGSSDSTPVFTSRTSINKFCSVVSLFSKSKRDFADQTGFGGMMGINILYKLNLRLSAHLMARVDPDKSELVLDGKRSFPITESDIITFFGLPQGRNQITSSTAELSPACIQFVKEAEAINDRGPHSLKVVENILGRHITEESSTSDIACFKMAFVIFCVGTILNPGTKHDHCTIDYWSALRDPAEINNYNWAAYVKDTLTRGARKFQADMKANLTAVNIAGCHFHLQMSVLDKITLSSKLIRQGVFPRVISFDQDTMRKAIDAISTHYGGETTFLASNCHLISQLAEDQAPNDREVIPYRNTEINTTKSYGIFHNKPMQSTPTRKPIVRGLTPKTGPREFASHLTRNHPIISRANMGIILREHNARVISNMNEMLNSTQLSMIAFVDKMVDDMANNCTCCKSHGRVECVLKNRSSPLTAIQHAYTPAPIIPLNSTTQSVSGSSSTAYSGCKKRLASEHLSVGSGCGKQSRKNISIEQPNFESTPDSNIKTSKFTIEGPRSDPHCLAKEKLDLFNDDLIALMNIGYQDSQTDDTTVRFGQCSDATKNKVKLSECSFAKDPWSLGSCPPVTHPTVAKAVENWISAATPATLARIWVDHPAPRLLLLDGINVRKEIIGGDKLSHDCCTLLCRRICQVDIFNTKDGKLKVWRKFMEPDFALTIMGNIDPRYVVSIQVQFLNDPTLDACRVFICPTMFHDGWVAYMFDMLKKKITVIDPQSGHVGYNNERVALHEHASQKIIDGFFSCVNHFFNKWHCNQHGWSRSFPVGLKEQFSSDESGICTIFMARNHDGDKLITPIDKVTLSEYRRSSLYEIMRLEGNKSGIPIEVLHNIKQSFTTM